MVVGHPLVLLEDLNWRELLKHCLAKNAYRGAGAHLVAAEETQRGRGGEGDGEVGEGWEPEGDGIAEIEKAIEQLAQMSLLGMGDLDRTFPESLEDMYAAYAEEQSWRVAL